MTGALSIAALMAGVAATTSAADMAGQVRIVQTNSGDDSIHLIDPATNAIVGEIRGVPINHGAAAAPDGSRLYFSSEAERVLAVVDSKTRQITKKIPLSGRPNNITISRDGRLVYVAIVSDPGAVDVIDTSTLERVKSIPTAGGIHNVYVTPDARYIIAGSIAGRKMIVIDARTQAPVWSLFNEGVRPIAIEKNTDGSTKRLFVQLSEVHGFAVVDFQQRKEVQRVMLPEIPEEQRDKGPFNGSPSHGIGVTPDGRSLWVASRPNGMAYEYSLPDLKLVGSVAVGKRPDWLTFTPDSKRLYVATESTNSVTVVDTPSRTVVTKITVGPSPKRNITAVLR
jgi:YVTN family beta-propeller protein